MVLWICWARGGILESVEADIFCLVGALLWSFWQQIGQQISIISAWLFISTYNQYGGQAGVSDPVVGDPVEVLAEHGTEDPEHLHHHSCIVPRIQRS